MIRQPQRSTPKPSSAASDVYKRQLQKALNENPEKRSLRIQLARKHSWDIRAQEIFYLLTNQSCKTQ